MKYENNHREAHTDEEYAIGVVGGGFITTTEYSIGEGWVFCRGKFDGSDAVEGLFEIPITSIRFVKTMKVDPPRPDPFYPTGEDF